MHIFFLLPLHRLWKLLSHSFERGAEAIQGAQHEAAELVAGETFADAHGAVGADGNLFRGFLICGGAIAFDPEVIA